MYCTDGSRDSPLKWYESFQRFMLLVQTVISEQIGFELDETVHGDSDLGEVMDTVWNSYVQGIDEPCVFVNRATGVRMVVFVDDLITRGSRQRTEELYTAIQSKYPMRSWNVLTPDNPLIHLGFEITEEVRDGELYRYMSQQREVEEFMREQAIEVHSEVSCPMPDKWHLGKNEELLDAEGKAVFKSMMGSFGWWSISLRYDIAQSVSRLQSKTESPTVSSLDAAYRLAAYIASTASFKLGGKVRVGLAPVRKLRSYETLNRWSSGQTNYFRERGPGSIPGAGTVKEILHFLQNGSTVGLEPAITQSQVGRSANCAGGWGGWVGLEPSE